MHYVERLRGEGEHKVTACCSEHGKSTLQGLGAPACARFLTSWYADKERGTFWGFWTASNNIGGFAAPILAGTAASMYGWRWGLSAVYLYHRSKAEGHLRRMTPTLLLGSVSISN
jgi:MFS family permease